MEFDEGSLCQTCFAGTLHLTAGILSCDVCGGTQQDFLEETQEYQGGNLRRSQHYSQNYATEWKTVQEKKDLPIQDGLIAYVEALQDLIQLQSKRMVGMGLAPPILLDVTREIWFTYLSVSGVLEPSFCKSIEEDVKKAEERMLSMEGVTSVNVVTSKQVVTQYLNKALPLSLSLATLFIGIWMIRVPLDPLDLSLLASTGDIPYISFWTLSRNTLEPYLGAITKSFLIPLGSPSPSKIYVQGRHLAQFLNLKVPMLNSAGFLQRYATKMGLPRSVQAPILCLNQIYYGKSYFLFPGYRTPWFSLSASFLTYVTLIKSSLLIKDELIREIETRTEDTLNWMSQLLPNAISYKKVASLSMEELRTLSIYLERTYFHFEERMEDFEFVSSLLDDFIARFPAETSVDVTGDTRMRPESIDIQVCRCPSIVLSPTLEPDFCTIATLLAIESWTVFDIVVQDSFKVQNAIMDAECKAGYLFSAEEHVLFEKWKIYVDGYRRSKTKIDHIAKEIAGGRS